MKKLAVPSSPQFRKSAWVAVFSVFLFFTVYLLMVAAAVVITVLCVIGAIGLVALFTNFVTVMLAIGLASMGFLILVFLFKFLFKKSTTDRSHLVELDLGTQPALRDLIADTVDRVGTRFPKRVYLSNEVNAAVFYDSSLLSMFFPVRKNLQIGLGLVNALSEEEFKAVLAHEFGHFSQRSMKLGSYVYYVNQVIYNLLYENDSYERLAAGWAGASGYFYIFVKGAVKIVQGAQWVLREMYGVVNRNYLSLSREMEFHADEIAAHVVGIRPVIGSFAKINRADDALQEVFRYYDSRIPENRKGKNAYSDHRFVMGFLASRGADRLPVRSELVISDQWASHPTDEERIQRLLTLSCDEGQDLSGPAMRYFSDVVLVEERMTEKLFETVQFGGEVSGIAEEEFCTGYRTAFLQNEYPSEFKGYYDFRNPSVVDLQEALREAADTSMEELFSQEMVARVYQGLSVEMDLRTVTEISTGNFKVKTFDYRGKKYSRKEAVGVIRQLEHTLEEINGELHRNDRSVFAYFSRMEQEQMKEPVLEKYYLDLFQAEEEGMRDMGLVQEMNAQLEFTRHNTPFAKIQSNFKKLEVQEKVLKSKIRKILSDARFDSELDLQTREVFEEYTSRDWVYFEADRYLHDHLELFLAAVREFSGLQGRITFIAKRGLLRYKLALLQGLASVTDTAPRLSGQAGVTQLDTTEESVPGE